MTLKNHSLQRFLDRRSRLPVGLFFAAILLIGLAIYKDYGLSWDEQINRDNGTLAFNYAFKGDPALLSYTDRYYGVAFEMPLILIEKILSLEASRQVFLMRHLATFLMFFLALIFFYRLVKDHFSSWKLGLLASLMLVLSPRLFAESFYNSKDLVFLSLFIISVYTLICFLDKRSWPRAAAHALVCALLIDVRVLGILVPGLTLFFFAASGLGEVRSRLQPGLKGLARFVFFLLLASGLTILFWPILWKNPLGQFLQAFKTMSRYPWDWPILYMGRTLASTNLPWHYISVWILITTPLFYSAAFLIGFCRSILEIFLRPLAVFRQPQRRNELVILFWLVIPLLAVIVFKSIVYDAWRHLYFIYPAFLIIAVKGILFLWTRFNSLRRGRKIFAPAFVLIVVGGMSAPAVFMIAHHPFQNVYFNSLARGDLRAKWELDYWGLSYRQGLEYVLAYDPSEQISVYVANYPGELNRHILKPEDQKRLVYSPQPEGATYVLTNYRWHPEDYPYANEIYSIIVGRAKILSIFKLR